MYIPLRSKLSRILLLSGLVGMFVLLHYTDLLMKGGVTAIALDRWTYTGAWQLRDYFLWLLVPPFILAIVGPLLVRWVKAGS